MMKRVGHEPQPAVIERRYNDFCFIYECILRSFHPSILGDFQVTVYIENPGIEVMIF
jgi:hypothetical protein